MEDVEQHPHDTKGHHPHGGQGFRIFFALDSLQFRPLSVQDPVPTGRQLIEIAGLDSFDDYSLFVILPSGDFEDIRLNETVDLRARGVERFIAFKTDRDFKFSLKGRQIVWGKPEIDGSDLYFLADVADEQAVFLDVRGGTDRLIEPDDTVDLSEAGIERFVVADKPKLDYIITVNSREYVLDDPNVTYEQIVS
ncbi:multiubiquitin domain-containing protein, partial [Vibrio sp. V06_P1A73T115]